MTCCGRFPDYRRHDDNLGTDHDRRTRGRGVRRAPVRTVHRARRRAVSSTSGTAPACSIRPPRVGYQCELATRAGVNERYVREWLGAMVTAGIFEYERPYVLLAAAEHAVCLTDDGGREPRAGGAVHHHAGRPRRRGHRRFPSWAWRFRRRLVPGDPRRDGGVVGARRIGPARVGHRAARTRTGGAAGRRCQGGRRGLRNG